MLVRNYEWILASGLALIIAVPFASSAKDPGKPVLAAAEIPTTEKAPTPAIDNIASTAIPVVPAAPELSEPTPSLPATASDQASPPDPLASLDPRDRAIAGKIGDLLATKLDVFFASKKEAAAVTAFYQDRKLAPLWLEKGAMNTRAASVIARMNGAAADGLEAGDYKSPNFTRPGPEAVAEDELKLTAAVVAFARHLQAGRFPYARMSRNIELPQATPEPADILGRVADAQDPARVLDSFSPPHEPYRKLKAMLAALRAKPGSGKGEIETVIANMERWRWYPRDLGNTHVLVNQPDFTLKVMHNGAQVWTTRIVIGKPTMPTPLLSEAMRSVTINPTWHVPASIVHNEYLPALAQDPTVLERMGLRVTYVSSHDVQITQPPGDGNALGRVRFNFPNRFSVYQHDTPNKDLFGHAFRAYSHGCMRVQNPAKYAEVLLNIARPNEHWTEQRIKSLFGNVERDFSLAPAQVQVHLTYQTAFVDDAGKLQIRPDVYGLDGRTLSAIKKERGTLEARDRKPEQEFASRPAYKRS